MAILLCAEDRFEVFQLSSITGMHIIKLDMCMSIMLTPTSENLPSPNHCSHLMPCVACRLPVALQVTTMPGHQENPLILPQTSSPMPKPLLSCRGDKRQLYETQKQGYYPEQGKEIHITPVLRSLHWLPVSYRIDF